MIRIATPQDAALVLHGLQALAADMGDPFRLTRQQLDLAMKTGAARAVLADEGQMGLALWSPFISTTRGAVGAYVSDLWVAEVARGQGLGQSLLAATRDAARAEFGAVFLRLSVYQGNPAAGRFYERLGFARAPGDIWLALEGAALEAI